MEMDMKTRKILLWAGVVVLFTAGAAMLFLSFGKPKDIPEDDINVIYTNVALTISAQQQTLQVWFQRTTLQASFQQPILLD